MLKCQYALNPLPQHLSNILIWQNWQSHKFENVQVCRGEKDRLYFSHKLSSFILQTTTSATFRTYKWVQHYEGLWGRTVHKWTPLSLFVRLILSRLLSTVWQQAFVPTIEWGCVKQLWTLLHSDIVGQHVEHTSGFSLSRKSFWWPSCDLSPKPICYTEDVNLVVFPKMAGHLFLALNIGVVCQETNKAKLIKIKKKDFHRAMVGHFCTVSVLGQSYLK